MQHGSLDVLAALLLTLLNRAKPLSHLTLRPRGHSGHQYLSQTPYAIRQAYLDRSARGLKPRFVKVAAPTDAEVAEVIATISQRVIRKLQKLRYLEADIDAAVATGYDPLADDEPELARTLAASVKQRIAFGARAGQQVRRIGSGFGYAGERPILTGPR